MFFFYLFIYHEEIKHRAAILFRSINDRTRYRNLSKFIEKKRGGEGNEEKFGWEWEALTYNVSAK